MNTIKLNNSEFEITGFNRNTYFQDGTVSSTAICDIRLSDISVLQALAAVTITSLQIKHNNDIIYNLADISARITNIGEYLNTDCINTTIGLTFDME